MFTVLRERINRSRVEERFEAGQAAQCDANLAQLCRIDPDAARIFTVSFTDAHRDPALQDQLTAQVKAYAIAKHAVGRLDLYNQLFNGI
jgi:hypothetical protein